VTRSASLGGSAPRPAQPPPAATFAAGSVRGMLLAFERAGHDVPSLLAAAGLRASDLADPDGRLPCAAMGALFAAACAARPGEALSLRLAQETPLGAYPLLDYLIVTSSTVGEGMRRYARHAKLTGAPLVITLHEDERPIRVEIAMPVGDSDYAVLLALCHLGREAPGFRADHVSFEGPRADASAYQAALGCPVRAGGSWSGFAVSRAVWSLPFRRRDPALQGVLERHAAEVLARIPAGGDVVDDLRRVLARRVSGGDTRLASVARELGLSTRTLQRRLAEASVAFQDVLDQCRLAAAERHLQDASLSIAEIAWLVGYSEPSAFDRAFKRWRGVSPLAYRRGPRAVAAR
jgi:AraC-like DNA-binding protein